jgi:hypothetical protein
VRQRPQSQGLPSGVLLTACEGPQPAPPARSERPAAGREVLA